MGGTPLLRASHRVRGRLPLRTRGEGTANHERRPTDSPAETPHDPFCETNPPNFRREPGVFAGWRKVVYLATICARVPGDVQISIEMMSENLIYVQ